MKFTLKWLKDYVDIGDLSPEALADRLTMLGLEVDSVTHLHQDLAPLKTGLVLSAEKHPNADKLTLCQVQIGDETFQIVCGAPNVRKDLAVVVALPGTVLPGDFKISKSKIRGVESHGMICSERELGLSDEHSGIMELPAGTEHGQSYIKAFGLQDTMIEVDLTPNRPDCASVIGLAREVAGIVEQPLRLPVEGAIIDQHSEDFAVEIEAPELCPRYAGRLIKNVKVGPSPWWLKQRLLAVGLRPINNIVDVTNYVMMEYGQPLHAFDFANLAGGKIVVRTPRDNEKQFTTLDNAARELDQDTLLICDGEKAVAVAGVMGGLNSEVTNETSTVLLESAYFNPVSIRRTARRLNLSTDASYRFERGVDPQGTVNAMNRAVELICQVSGGTAPADGIDCYPGHHQALTLELRVSKTKSLLGIDIEGAQIAQLLGGIGIPATQLDDETLTVVVPSFRVDLEREADLIEEVARLHGYDNIPTALPHVALSYPDQDPQRLRRLHVASEMVAAGFTEAINYSFGSDKHWSLLEFTESDRRASSVKLLNPLSEDQAVMRTSLLPGLLENTRRNINFQKTAIRLFEIGKVFFPTEPGSQPHEPTRLAGVLSGNRCGEASPLHYKTGAVDIYDTKGAVEFILTTMGLDLQAAPDGLHFVPPQSPEPFSQKGYSLEVRNGHATLGSLGKIRTDILRKFAIKHEVYYFDLDFEALCSLGCKSTVFQQLPVFPSVKRDIALVVQKSVSAGDLLAMVTNSPEKLIESCEVFDVFTGEKLGEGLKSVALTITYRSATKTLTEKNVEKVHDKIVKALTDRFGGSLRNA